MAGSMGHRSLTAASANKCRACPLASPGISGPAPSEGVAQALCNDRDESAWAWRMPELEGRSETASLPDLIPFPSSALLQTGTRRTRR